VWLSRSRNVGRIVVVHQLGTLQRRSSGYEELRDPSNNYAIRATVTVRPRGATQLLVRANAQYNVQPVTDPEPYQQFFAALEKSVFLTAHHAD
jgi:hypothetical protein